MCYAVGGDLNSSRCENIVIINIYLSLKSGINTVPKIFIQAAEKQVNLAA
jgi:hypothetical protein